MKCLTAVVGICLVASSSFVWAGGELPAGGRAPSRTKFHHTIPAKKIGPISGSPVAKEPPMPSPYRPVGWGMNCHEFYGPTYYYPDYHNMYESLNPSYYPFYHPRWWPNYKSDGQYCPGNQCGSSRSSWNWDSYDDWTRGGRYEERQ